MLVSRSRFGFRVDVHRPQPDRPARQRGARPAACSSPCWRSSARCPGIAGYVQVAGVTNRINAEFSVGYGFTAIIVALLGRLHPVGVLIAALGLSGLTIGFDVAEREHQLPSTLVGVVQALIIIFVVVGDAVVAKPGAGGGAGLMDVVLSIATLQRRDPPGPARGPRRARRRCCRSAPACSTSGSRA